MLSRNGLANPALNYPRCTISFVSLSDKFFFFFWHAQCLCWPQLCLKFSLSYIQGKKNYITHHPPPFSLDSPHVSMHTHVILFCTKGDHRKWCSYIEGDLFWQHSTIEGKPLFRMKQKENTALFH